MDKKIPYILIAVLIATQVYSITKINRLGDRMYDLEITVEEAKSQIQSNINSAYFSVNQSFAEQESLLLASSYEVGELNVEALTASVTFTVEPKTVTETMQVSLEIDGEIIPLEKTGLKYSATKEFGIMDEIVPKVMIEDNGVQQIQQNAGLAIYGMIEEVFPQIHTDYMAGSSWGAKGYGSNNYEQEGQLEIYCEALNDNNTFVDVKYVMKLNDEVVRETPIDLDEDGNATITIDGEFAVEDGQTLTGRIVAVDSLGFIHEALLSHYEGGSNMQREPYFDEVDVKDANGKLLFRY